MPYAYERARDTLKKTVFLSLFVATTAAMLGIGIIMPVLPLYAKSLGATAFVIGLLSSAFALSRLLFAPYIGSLSDSYGKKKLLVIGLSLYIVFSIAYALASNVAWLFIIRFVEGFASAMVTPVAQAYIGDIVPRGKEGEYMNLFIISLFIGNAVGPFLGGYLSDVFSFSMPFYAMGGMALIALLMVIFFVPEIKSQASEKRKSARAIRKIIKDSKMLGVLFYILFRSFYRFGFNTFLPLLVVGFMSKTNIGLLLSAYMVSGSLLQYPMGKLGDSHPQFKAIFVLVGSLLSAVSMVLIFIFYKNVLMLYILSLSMGGFSALARGSVIAIRTERGRKLGMGAVTGSFASFQALGQITGPVVLGIFVYIFGLPSVFLVGGSFGIIGAVLTYAFIRG